MKIKRKLGMGLKKNKRKNKLNKVVSFQTGVLSKVRNRMRLKQQPTDILKGSNIALAVTKSAKKNIRKNTIISAPRVIPIPKQ